MEAAVLTKRRFQGRGLVTCVVLIAAVLGTMSLTSADSVGISVCVNKKSGVMRQILKGKCKKTERMVAVAKSSTAQGAVATQGPQGLQGATGATGAAGSNGATGAEGPRGLTGETGAPGETGPRGLTGEPGPQGETGLRGLTGETGPSGSTILDSETVFLQLLYGTSAGYSSYQSPSWNGSIDASCFFDNDTIMKHRIEMTVPADHSVLSTIYPLSGSAAVETKYLKLGVTGTQTLGSSRTIDSLWVITKTNVNSGTRETIEIYVDMIWSGSKIEGTEATCEFEFLRRSS